MVLWFGVAGGVLLLWLFGWYLQSSGGPLPISIFDMIQPTFYIALIAGIGGFVVSLRARTAHRPEPFQDSPHKAYQRKSTIGAVWIAVGVAGALAVILVLLGFALLRKTGVSASTVDIRKPSTPHDVGGGAGVSASTVDIRKVIADPEAYAGRTLKSRVKIDAPTVYSAPAARNAMPLFLMADAPLEEKAIRILNAVGEYQSVMIKYRIHNKSMFAKIRAREAAEERVERDRIAREEQEAKAAKGVLKEADLGPPIELPPVPPPPNASTEARAAYEAKLKKYEAKAKQREAAYEAEAEADDPMDYQGVLIDIWIP